MEGEGKKRPGFEGCRIATDEHGGKREQQTKCTAEMGEKEEGSEIRMKKPY